MAGLRFIPPRIHGMLDYTSGVLMGTSPTFVKGIKRAAKQGEERKDRKYKPEKIIPYVMGGISGLYSFFTNYELGVVRKIPMKVHLLLDAIGGIFLAASPWIFGFNKKVWIPFVGMGAFEVGTALLTQFETSSSVIDDSFDV